MEHVSLQEFTQSLQDPKLGSLIHSIGDMAAAVRKEFPHKLKLDVGSNRYGEITKELDVWANDFFGQSLLATGMVKKVYSEEMDTPFISDSSKGPYYVAMDPLDGSSNIASNNCFGTILGIWKKDLPAKGIEQVASLYVLYGPITTLVFTDGHGTHEFVKHRKGKEQFVLMHEDMELPSPAKVYGSGADPLEWFDAYRSFINDLVNIKRLKNRYSGAFVGDFSQVLHYGGFFAYPGTQKNPQGKFRLYYEGAPMGFLIENAGGKSSDGKQDLLQVKGHDADARTPVYVGNKEIVAELETLLRKELV